MTVNLSCEALSPISMQAQHDANPSVSRNCWMKTESGEVRTVRSLCRDSVSESITTQPLSYPCPYFRVIHSYPRKIRQQDAQREEVVLFMFWCWHGDLGRLVFIRRGPREYPVSDTSAQFCSDDFAHGLLHDVPVILVLMRQCQPRLHTNRCSLFPRLGHQTHVPMTELCIPTLVHDS